MNKNIKYYDNVSVNFNKKIDDKIYSDIYKNICTIIKNKNLNIKTQKFSILYLCGGTDESNYGQPHNFKDIHGNLLDIDNITVPVTNNITNILNDALTDNKVVILINGATRSGLFRIIDELLDTKFKEQKNRIISIGFSTAFVNYKKYPDNKILDKKFMNNNDITFKFGNDKEGEEGKITYGMETRFMFGWLKNIKFNCDDIKIHFNNGGDIVAKEFFFACRIPNSSIYLHRNTGKDRFAEDTLKILDKKVNIKKIKDDQFYIVKKEYIIISSPIYIDLNSTYKVNKYMNNMSYIDKDIQLIDLNNVKILPYPELKNNSKK